MTAKIGRPMLILAILGCLTSMVEARTAPTCFGRRATIVGTSKGETIFGTTQADVIVGRGGPDEIHGRAGDDLICGNTSALPTRKGGTLETGDRIDGGRGDDRITGGRGYDELFGGPGDDTLRSGVILGGGPGNDLLIGGNSRDEFSPGPGRDRVVDERSFDHDFLDYSTAAAPVSVNLGNGVARGQGHDSIAGVDGVWGSDFKDLLVGDQHNNTLAGGEGRDRLYGLNGADKLTGGHEFDRLFGGRGHDLCYDRSAQKENCTNGYKRPQT
jgi:Ca2+-binding RTX toxin-like protein